MAVEEKLKRARQTRPAARPALALPPHIPASRESAPKPRVLHRVILLPDASRAGEEFVGHLAEYGPAEPDAQVVLTYHSCIACLFAPLEHFPQQQHILLILRPAQCLLRSQNVLEGSRLHVDAEYLKCNRE